MDTLITVGIILAISALGSIVIRRLRRPSQERPGLPSGARESTWNYTPVVPQSPAA
jgi:hypothetical protein